jgi:maltooligosyltrehalose trehalohydrolase
MSQLLDFSAIRTKRRLPIGAELVGEALAHFRVWAPAAQRVDVVLDGGARTELAPEPAGYFAGAAHAQAGDRYRFRLDSSDRLYPDPASRFQPEGPHGPSMIVDPGAFNWTDAGWKGIALEGQIIYELHVGTFTREGTWAAAARELPELAHAGVTLLELMPIAEFEGRYGWGYDGVDLFAPSHLHGGPDDFRRFVDRAHALGIGVILDVVYNHLGPVGNYLRAFAPAYFSDRYENEWGDAINFDGDNAGPVREFFTSNGGYWIDEFHLDGLRLDATQQIFDQSPENVMVAVGARVREQAKGRSTVVIGENEPQDIRLVRPLAEGGYGLDALWNDDFHHSAMAALSGHAEAYYSDTRGDPQEFISAAKYGYLFQGQYYHWQRQPRGTPSLDLPPARFVIYLQNHDQIANSARGLRGHQLTSPGKWRAMTAGLLLFPGTPMLFQGQEFAASSPFLYFADFEEELAAAVRRGRADFLRQFPSIVAYRGTMPLDDPGDPDTFERCKLDFSERATNAALYDLHKDLIRMRRETAAFRAQAPGGVDGAVLSPHAFALRFFTGRGADDRVVIINLGADLNRGSFAEPLLAPPVDHDWSVQWSSEEPRYGGGGVPPLESRRPWTIRGESAIVLAPTRKGQSPGES